MYQDKKQNITRKKFVKNVAGTALCCACLPLSVFADPARTSANSNGKNNLAGMTGTDKVHLAAVCGTFCGACPAYLAKHGDDEQKRMRLLKRSSSGQMKAQKTIPAQNWMDGILCDGCLSNGDIAAHCQGCAMKRCAANKQDVTRCSDCTELPCSRITNFINTGLLHRAEYLPNLQKIREMGVEEWVAYEEERWRCPRCGLPMSWYDAECPGCGNPRSDRVFPLPEK